MIHIQITDELSRGDANSNLKQRTQVFFVFIRTVQKNNCRLSLLIAFL